MRFDKLEILLVEDNEINQEVAHGVFNEEIGVNLHVANNGLFALEVLKYFDADKPLDLVLMDCQMPEMDGYTCTRAIRAGVAGRRFKDVPIIALTANAMKGDAEKCLASGMNSYLSKPIEPEMAFAEIAKLLPQKSSFRR